MDRMRTGFIEVEQYESGETEQPPYRPDLIRASFHFSGVISTGSNLVVLFIDVAIGVLRTRWFPSALINAIFLQIVLSRWHITKSRLLCDLAIILIQGYYKCFLYLSWLPKRRKNSFEREKLTSMSCQMSNLQIWRRRQIHSHTADHYNAC
jgi:hypothetical protein